MWLSSAALNLTWPSRYLDLDLSLTIVVPTGICDHSQNQP